MAMIMHESEPHATLHPDAHASARPHDQPGESMAVPPIPAPPVPVPITEKTLLYSCAMTYTEYVAASLRREFLEIRGQEIRLLPQEQAYFSGYPDPIHWLIVTDEGPDTLVVLPLLAHVAAWAPRLSLRVVRDEEAAPLLAALVEDSGLLAQCAEADLPLLLSFDEEWRFQEQWGPHPQAIDGYLEEWLAAHGEVDQLADDESSAGQEAYARLQELLLQEMRMWYNSSLNQASGVELRSLLVRWRDENGGENGDDASEDAGA